MRRFRVAIGFSLIILSVCVYFVIRHRPRIVVRIPCIDSQSVGVTRIIHQSWKNKTIPPVFQRYFPSWRTCFPDWEHKFWTDIDNRNLVIEHFPWYLEIYDGFPKEIYRADVARYLYLYVYGGLYTDLDNECLAPFEHLLEDYTFVFGTIDGIEKKTPLAENYVQNSFMYSRPRQTFWLELINNIHEEIHYDTPDIVTGPEHLCNVIHAHRLACPRNHGVKIYDAWYFNPLSWNSKMKYDHCNVYQYMNKGQWHSCREMLRKNGSFVVQYHSHQWGKEFS